MAAEPEVALPALESLGSTSDYAAFLQRGVSAALQQQALARAWTSDAGIAGFRGMAEYDWDFNAAGYGRLRVADDVATLLRAVLSQPPEQTALPEPAAEPVAVRLSLQAEPADSSVDAALLPTASASSAGAGRADDGVDAPERPMRRHGSAKPV